MSLMRNDRSYVWLGESLGGYRPTGMGESSLNRSWRNESFRNYADYAMTKVFRSGLDKLKALNQQGITAFMCAEKPYIRCHRRIISDYLFADGYNVVHIIEPGLVEQHKLTPTAVINEGILTYPEKTPN
jgi:uncharacterized protein (DUF488 family)